VTGAEADGTRPGPLPPDVLLAELGATESPWVAQLRLDVSAVHAQPLVVFLEPQTDVRFDSVDPVGR
jgi:hypothetical protein